MRIEKKTGHVQNLKRGKPVRITVNQIPVTAYEGELVSTVLHCEGIHVFQRKQMNGNPSGIFCGMGICYECLVTIDGVPNVRTCQMPVLNGMIVSTDIEEQS